MKHNTENETKHADAASEEKGGAAESDFEAENGGEISIDALRRENDELREKLALEAARETVIAESKKAAAISPQLIFESVKSDLKFNKEGVAENAAEAVARFKKRFPEQFSGKTPTGSIDGGAGIGSSPMQLTANMLSAMTPAEIARLDWNDVRRVLSA